MTADTIAMLNHGQVTRKYFWNCLGTSDNISVVTIHQRAPSHVR